MNYLNYSGLNKNTQIKHFETIIVKMKKIIKIKKGQSWDIFAAHPVWMKLLVEEVNIALDDIEITIKTGKDLK